MLIEGSARHFIWGKVDMATVKASAQDDRLVGILETEPTVLLQKEDFPNLNMADYDLVKSPLRVALSVKSYSFCFLHWLSPIGDLLQHHHFPNTGLQPH